MFVSTYAILKKEVSNMPIIGKAKREANKGQDNVVAKGNDIIQKSRYEMNAQQSKVLLYLISLIKPDDDISKAYTFSVSDFCKACGITQSGKNSQNAQAAIKALADKSIWVQQTSKTQVLLRWLSTVTLHNSTNQFEITFHPDMLPYLYSLKTHYTSYQLSNVLTMKSKYSIRLYELLKSYQHVYDGMVSFTLAELQDRLDAKDYDRYTNFNQRVLSVAVEEINECSDISVEYEPYSTSGKQRGFDGITFTISEPTALDKEMRAIRQERKLDSQTKATFKTLIEAITPEN